jgi:hypothetical protein
MKLIIASPSPFAQGSSGAAREVDPARHPLLARFSARVEARPSLAATRPEPQAIDTVR